MHTGTFTGKSQEQLLNSRSVFGRRCSKLHEHMCQKHRNSWEQVVFQSETPRADIQLYHFINIPEVNPSENLPRTISRQQLTNAIACDTPQIFLIVTTLEKDECEGKSGRQSVLPLKHSCCDKELCEGQNKPVWPVRWSTLAWSLGVSLFINLLVLTNYQRTYACFQTKPVSLCGVAAGSVDVSLHPSPSSRGLCHANICAHRDWHHTESPTAGTTETPPKKILCVL